MHAIKKISRGSPTTKLSSKVQACWTKLILGKGLPCRQVKGQFLSRHCMEHVTEGFGLPHGRTDICWGSALLQTTPPPYENDIFPCFVHTDFHKTMAF